MTKLTGSVSKARREATKLWLQFKWMVVGLVGLVVLATLLDTGLGRYQAWVFDQTSRALQVLARAYGKAAETHLRALVGRTERTLDLRGAADRVARGAAAIAQGRAQGVPGLLGARFIPPGVSEVDRSRNPPIGYAVLAMISDYEATGKPLLPEVLYFGGKDQQVDLLRPLRKDDRVLGYVLLAFDVSVLTRALEGVRSDFDHYVALEQGVAGKKPLRIAERGARAAGSGIAFARQAVPGTPWKLAIWPGADLAASGAMVAYAWAGYGALAVLVLGATGFLTVRTRLSERRRPVFGGAAAPPSPTEADDAVLASFDAAQVRADDGRRLASFAYPEPTGLPLPEVEVEEGDPERLLAGKGLGPEAAGGPPPLPSEAQRETADASGRPSSSPSTDSPLPPLAVFRAYDIRGIVGPGFEAGQFRALGAVIGSEAHDRGQQTVVVGRDGRLSAPELHAAVVSGLCDSGRDVIDIGLVPTPVLYFATHYLNTGTGVMVTASHNPAPYNGLKIVLAGETLSGAEIRGLRERLERRDVVSGEGSVQEMDLLSEYIRRVSEDVPVALGNAFRLVLDCGNGVAGVVAPKLFRALGHDVVELHCEVDGSFPNHEPDTSNPENLADLARSVVENEADLGLGFDGDGDRLAVVDGRGTLIFPDRLMMLYARDILSRIPGARIVYDVKCSSRLAVIVSKLGGQPVMWKTGHSFLKRKLKDEGAELAGDFSGHIFFEERWYGFDDAMYAAARLLEILMAMKQSPTDILARLPSGVATPEIRVEVAEGAHHDFMARFVEEAEIEDAQVSRIDGYRADFADGWGLIRASNTTPALTLRFEGRNDVALSRIQNRFKALIRDIDPSLELPF